MSQRIYRSARGNKIDMGELVLRHEDVRAVGNMKVNAKGDVLDSANKVAKTRNEQVNKHYRKQIKNQVVDVPPSPNTLTTPPEQQIMNDEPVENIGGLDVEDKVIEKKETETVEKNSSQPVIEKVKEEPKAKTTKKKSGGLAGAIAKAREVEKKKLKTTKDESKSISGVKKI